MSKNTKTWLVGGVSALAMGCFFTGSALAGGDVIEPMKPGPERTISGNLDVFFGGTWLSEQGARVNGSSADDEWGFIGGAAKVDIPFSDQHFSFQVDLDGEVTFAQGSSTNGANASGNYAGGTQVGGHLNYREMDQYLFGVFGGVGVAAIQDSASTGAEGPHYFVGVEGQMYFGDTTAYAQVGYFDSDHQEGTDVFADAWFIRGVLRHYFNGGHTMLQASLAYADGSHGGSSVADEEMIEWGFKVEHQLFNWGNDGFMSIYGEYIGRDFDETTPPGFGLDDGHEQHTIMVGVSFNLNQYSLKTRERTGVALDLPDIERWVAGPAWHD